jgi:hypothetical protein
MQLTNSTCIVDYFPEAFIAEACDIKGMKVIVKRFIKRVHFIDAGKGSYSVISATDFKHEVANRIAQGAEVTDYNTEKMPQSEYMPMAVGC